MGTVLHSAQSCVAGRQSPSFGLCLGCCLFQWLKVHSGGGGGGIRGGVCVGGGGGDELVKLGF